MKSDIDSVFVRYGFAPGFSTNDQTHLVYTIRSGYFHQAEILVLDPSDRSSITRTRKALEESGYACTERAFDGALHLEQRLFEGFFVVDETRIRHRQQYDAFTDRTERAIGGPYEYISGPYIENDRPGAEPSLPDAILKSLDGDEPTLILIEAAAGFGKTCTAYELLRVLIERQPRRPPLFVELARNRRAPIFRYVLLDEIDRYYPSLNSELVTHEISAGNVPLVVDGFDELLRQSIDVSQEATSEKLETMLDTIAALLHGRAKIILTTRRTAMFSSDAFDAWTASRTNNFRAVRFGLQAPSLRDWLGQDRANRIEELVPGSGSLSNPVLLSVLRASTDEQFERYVVDTDLLVEQYFQGLLEREMERQDINIPHAEQRAIYVNVAEHMLKHDILADSRKNMIEVIETTGREYLEASTKRYAPASRPTLQQLAERLAGHALLDRLGQGEDQIGFINEFIAGTLFADVLIRTNDAVICSEKTLDLATFAFNSRSVRARENLYQAIGPMLPALNAVERLVVALRLLGRFPEQLSDETLEGLTFESMGVGAQHEVLNCTFVRCTFRRITFNGARIARCGFLECRFYDCTVVGTARECWEFGSDAFPTSEVLSKLLANRQEFEEEETDYELEVLQQFWPKGRAHANDVIALRTMFRGFSPSLKSKVEEALESLKRTGLVVERHDAVALNMERIGEIRARLGRGS